MDSRAAYREEYKSSKRTNKNLDFWMKQNTSTSFRTKQRMMSRKGSDTHQGHVRDQEWREVRRDTAEGSAGAVFPVLLILGAIIMLWTANKSDSSRKKK